MGTGGGDGWWRRVVETGGGDGSEIRTVTEGEGQTRRPGPMSVSPRTSGIKRRTKL